MKLIDTSAWIEYLRATKTDTCLEVSRLLMDREGVWCDMVSLELANFVSSRQEARLQKVDLLAWTAAIDSDVWSYAKKLATACRRAGVTAPTPDFLIFAVAELNGFELLHHNDQDFYRIERVARTL